MVQLPVQHVTHAFLLGDHGWNQHLVLALYTKGLEWSPVALVNPYGKQVLSWHSGQGV